MRREGKPGPFIPSEVPAQTGPARATTPAPARRRRRATRAVGARAKRPRSGDDVYARAETLAPARERMRAGDNARMRPCDDGCRAGGVFFHKHPKLQRLSDDVCVRATTPASGRRRTCAPGRQRLRPCDDGCRAGGVFFHKHPKLQRSGDDVCVRATTVAHGRRRPTLARRRLDPIVLTLAFFFAFAIQTKLFHYPFSRITQILLKMVIQSYFY